MQDCILGHGAKNGRRDQACIPDSNSFPETVTLV